VESPPFLDDFRELDLFVEDVLLEAAAARFVVVFRPALAFDAPRTEERAVDFEAERAPAFAPPRFVADFAADRVPFFAGDFAALFLAPLLAAPRVAVLAADFLDAPLVPFPLFEELLRFRVGVDAPEPPDEPVVLF
jgi:hypothetical protein